MHLLKKIVNALWHSDLKEKSRDLMKLWWNPVTDDFEWTKFSLKTLEKVFTEEERGGGSRSAAEEAANLKRFRKMDAGMFQRNSYNCMSVSIAAKVRRTDFV